MFLKFSNSDLAISSNSARKGGKTRPPKFQKKIWVHHAWKRRPVEREFITLYPHLMDDERKFYEFFRMTQAIFHDLLAQVENYHILET